MLTGFSFCRRTASAEHHHHPCMHTYLSRIISSAFASVSDHTFQQPTLDTRRTSDGQANYVYLQTYDRNAHTFNTSTWDCVLRLDSVCLCVATSARWPIGLAVICGPGRTARPWSELAGPSRGKTCDLGSGQFQVEIRARRDNEELTEGMRAIGR